ncbi:CHRD domain-containing protein [Psychroflexus tropicus]|uniref:CHRD domain-containing protein n=1 Tax=Psychroflexus tropicus TaxID=197345 RepID=UPI00035D5480|nr:CHRD domain-containing protein [Psychroflexus tropicus]
MKKIKNFILPLFLGLFIVACDNDDSLNPVTDPILDNIRYDLGELNDSGVSGDAVFNEQEDGSIQLIVEVEGTSPGNMHPAHIHMNAAFETGPIIVSLEPVDGATGLSITEFTSDVDGNPISFEDIEGLDAYINVHLNPNDDTVVAQGNIGQNDFTGEEKSYDLGERAVPGISGTVLFKERANGFALATISLEGTPDDGLHPAHIHMNTAAQGGDIIFSFNPVNGATGISNTDTNESAMEGENAFTFEEILGLDAYVNIHLSAEELETIVAQGDIGQNELTGESKTYELGEKDVEDISGSILFEERANGFALATISLENTIEGEEHPAHIHMNSAIIGGSIIFSFNSVNGTSGISTTESDESAMEGENAISYAEILEADAYVNVHLGPGDDLATIVAQGDIGSNELTGESITYTLNEVDVMGINGEITFEERINGFALATIDLVGTPADGMHPAHIHAGEIVDNGPIIFSFNPVDGATGMSMSDTRQGNGDDEDSFTYADILEIAGYVNVHLSATELETIVAQGDIGANLE